MHNIVEDSLGDGWEETVIVDARGILSLPEYFTKITRLR